MDDHRLRSVLCVQHQDDCPPGHVGERLTDLGAELEIVDVRRGSLPDPREFDLVLSLGSDDAAHDEGVQYLRAEWKLLETAVDADVPVFGICFGGQLLSRVLGGSVAPLPDGPEIGWLPVESDDPEMFEPGPWLVWHLDGMTPPPGAAVVARTDRATQAFATERTVGVQFHPEVTMEGARVWSTNYRDQLLALGLDPDELLEQVRVREPETRRRAHRLTDRVLERFGFWVTQPSQRAERVVAAETAQGWQVGHQ